MWVFGGFGGVLFVVAWALFLFSVLYNNEEK